MRKTRPPSLRTLLQAVHDDRNDLALSTLSEAQIGWVLASGLGPLLVRAVARDPVARDSPHWPALVGAERAAQVLATAQIEATAEIIDACRPYTTVTLLKGISLAERDYPLPHLRPMRDIDVLVPEDVVGAVQRAVLNLGYREHVDPRFEAYGHHAHPLVHRHTGIWIEVHHRLFPPPLEGPGVDPFAPERVAASLRPSTFAGRVVHRLSDELQVAYVASHWALSPSRVHGGGAVVPMLDVIQLLKRRAVRWDDVVESLRDSHASAHLHLLLGYLRRCGVTSLPEPAMARLARMQPSLDAVRCAILHRILDRYVLEGRQYRGWARPATLDVTWQTLLSAGLPAGNLARVPWRILRRFAARLPGKLAVPHTARPGMPGR
jgi:hypothetical protein